MKLLIELTTKENQTVLDPFAGSATTLVAALELNRHFIGFEQNEEYFKIAKKRINDEKMKPKQNTLIDIYSLS